MIAPRNNLTRVVSGLIGRNKPPIEIKILSFKKDRAVVIRLASAEQVEVVEDGFDHRSFFCNETDLPKLIRDIADREFPRSHQLKISLKRN
ncbi:MAG: hypothetical protein B2I17_08860 [Thermoplasmatales archaeon B_DKE]|nr:MAG: hypothetical protein B2I17_08860 [Thermoplasmatales archaeon B_DKE]